MATVATIEIPFTHTPLKLAEIQEMEVISRGHWDNLLYEKEKSHQIKISRMTKADGEPYDNRVIVTKYDPKTGTYKESYSYKAR